MSDIRDQIRRHIVATHLSGEDPASLKDDTPLITGGILDSQGLADLLSWCGAEFGAAPSLRDIADEGYDIARVDTIGAIAREIEGAWARSACEPREAS